MYFLTAPRIIAAVAFPNRPGASALAKALASGRT